jgi:hypothetical protein
MDPVSIAAGVGALLAPYLKKAAEAFAGEAGKYVHEKAKRLWEKLRAKFEDDPQAEKTLDRFEADPDGASADFQAQVKKKVEEDSSLRDELAQVLADIKRQAPYVKVVLQVTEAERVIGVQAERMTRGTVDVTMDVEKAKDVTGAKIGEIV